LRLDFKLRLRIASGDLLRVASSDLLVTSEVGRRVYRESI
jgi:hypothetical protein